jgi:NAD(P)-dependent dehydrogenase (short-subunit alcohol dehydrogenase family)
MNRLDGKVALISGAARGIGGETARLMVEAGATVAIGDLLDERGRETARTLGDAALYVHLDVTSEEHWSAAVAAALARFAKRHPGNKAGLFLGKDIEAASLAEWERLCAVNLTGVFLGTKLCPHDLSCCSPRRMPGEQYDYGKGGGDTEKVEEQPHALRNYLTTRHPNQALMLLNCYLSFPSSAKVSRDRLINSANSCL